jgi:microcystin-dependent protein
MPTANYDLNLMFENSLQKELIINENFFTIDSLVVCKVIDFIDSLPSDNLKNGDTWIISENSAEFLQNRRGNIVLYSGNNGFRFIEPKNGMVVFISSKKAIIAHENNRWVNFTLEQVSNNSDIGDTSSFAKLTDLAQYQKSADSVKINDSESSTSSVYSSKKIDDAILLAISSINIPQSSSGGSSAVSNFVGDYKQSAILDNHSGWLMCNGNTILRSKYQDLFKLIGESFGSGDGSTTFNLPDFRGKVFGCTGLGVGLSDRSIGSYVGEEKHLMTEAEIPKHRHAEKLGTTSLTMGSGDGQGGVSGTRITYTSGLTGVVNMTDFAGYGNSFNVMQPTLFGGNIFIFSGVIS